MDFTFIILFLFFIYVDRRNCSIGVHHAFLPLADTKYPSVLPSPTSTIIPSQNSEVTSEPASPKPTILPTQLPSVEHTLQPSISNAPTLIPSINPQYAPSIRPTTIPTFLPSTHSPTSLLTSFTCQSLPQEYTPHMVCSGVVNYPFYLPTNQTLENFENFARKKVANLTVSFGNPCVSNLKKFACAEVYYPCVPGVIPGKASTYDSVTGLPYKRTCRSICDNIYSTCSSYQQSQLSYYNYPFPNCDATYPDSTISVYEEDDELGSNSTCNNLHFVSNITVVSDMVENYRGEACAGLINSTCIGESHLINSTFAPLLPSFILQEYLENKYSKVLKQIPHSFSESCLKVQYKILCASVFLHPGYSIIRDVSVQTIISPEFPYYYDCIDYLNKCANLIVRAPRLWINCSSTLVLGSGVRVHTYPKNLQVVTYVFEGKVAVYGNAFYLSNMSTPNVTTNCPDGFSVSANVNAQGQVMITDACAMNCPSPIYSQNERASQDSTLTISAWINSVFISLQLINLYNQHPERQNKLLFISIAATFSYTFYNAFQRTIVKPASNLICLSPTQWYYSPNPFNSYIPNKTAGSCYFYALLTLYMEFIFYIGVLLVFIELWFVIVRKRDISPYRIYYYAISAVYVLFHVVLVTFYGRPVTVQPGQATTTCRLTTGDTITDYFLRYFPHMIIYIMSLLLGGHVVYRCFRIRTKTLEGNDDGANPLVLDQVYENPLFHLWHFNRLLLLFLFVFLFFYGPIDIWVYTYVNLVQGPLMVQSVKDWTTCVFSNYIDSSSQEYVNQLCGVRPKYIIPLETSVPILLLFIGYNVGVFLITLDSDAREFWKVVGSKVAKFTRGWVSPDYESAGLRKMTGSRIHMKKADRNSKEMAKNQKRQSAKSGRKFQGVEGTGRGSNTTQSGFDSGTNSTQSTRLPIQSSTLRNKSEPLITPKDHEESPGF